ncbi:MAG: iron export ABC transporter permease subunit FetB [Sphingomonadaceae bacterium]|nr:iron export ABC transporter permease subunit FetB [Sphingomonadaceae bacterium]
MTSVITLDPLDLALASSLVLVDIGLSIGLRLGLHRGFAIAAVRMTAQLAAIGFVLRFIFQLGNPAATLGVVLVMGLIAAREVAVRPKQRFHHFGSYAVAILSVTVPTILTVALALATAIRPSPWFDPRYLVPLAGIILGNVLNAASLTLDGVLGGTERERETIEARLALGTPYWIAMGPTLREAMRRGLVPIINQMSAAGVVTLPGIMTGQIIAGMDPIEAAKYQILLMFLLSGGSGIAVVACGYLAARKLTDDRQRLRLDRLITPKT